MSETFTINFDYTIEGLSKTINLNAVVEKDESDAFYIIYDIKTNSQSKVLSNQKIKKLKGQWVHIDSQQQSNLSKAIGNAIDQKVTQRTESV